MPFRDKVERLLSSYQQASKPLPRVTLGAINREGTFRFSETYIGAQADAEEVNAVHYLASSTKLVTTIAVLQCTEKGLLHLDADVSTVLPEFAAAKILTGFTETDQPIFTAASKPVTLRHLLTHSSGLAYAGMEPLLPKYHTIHKMPYVNNTVETSYPAFLISEPGEQWMYSPGVDWAGAAVERVTSMKLGEYMQRHIFEPVSVTDATLHLEDRPDLRARQAKYWRRAGETLEQTKPSILDPIEGDLGGAGLYTTVNELLKIYHGILSEKLLQQTTLDQMFKPQLECVTGLDAPAQYSLPYRNAVFNSIPNDVPVNFGLGGLLNLEPVPGRRGSCSLTWSGKPNLYWWIDPTNGVAGIFMSQLEPTGDQTSVELLTEFEEFVYSSMKNKH